jgi:hypothetical protein
MPPRKIINKSRPLGGKPRNSTPASEKKTRKPKDSKPKDTTPKEKVDPLAIAASLVAPSKGTSTPATSNGATPTKAQAYTGLSQVPHGLSFPSFEPDNYFAKDLFTNSSPLAETEKEDADKAVESIEKKRQTLRVVGANIALNTDVVKVANDYRKFEGSVLDYATTGVNNEIKFINYQTAEVNRDIAGNRYDQAQERLNQGQRVLAGMQSITPLIDEEWQQRKSLKQSQIHSLKVAAVQAREALEPKLMQLSQNFREELADLN